MSFWQENKIVLAIVLGAGLIAAALYFGLTNKKVSLVPNRHQASLLPSPAVSNTPPRQISPQPSPTGKRPTPTLALEISYRKSDLLAALSEKTNIPENEINFSVSEEIKKENKILLRGSVSREGEMGGAAFFAVVDKNGVTVTFTGQGVPQCSEVNPYGYPVAWVDYCVDGNGQTVAR
jgi:hypothetical protein